MELSAKNNTVKTELDDQVTFGLNMASIMTNMFWRSKNPSSKHDKVVLVSSIVGTLLFLHFHYTELGLQGSPFFGL